MAKFHYVEDYERLVAQLVASYPLDEAMSLAVGGDYDRIGRIEAQILAYAGLVDEMCVFDLGCGSGRLATALSARFSINFIGTDVVQTLLDYATVKNPKHYRFLRNEDLTVPLKSESVDIASAFSVFTHLLHEETFLYLTDMRRTLKPGGRIIFSYLEFDMQSHWTIFDHTVRQRQTATRSHLNVFIETSAIQVWAQNLDLEVVETIRGDCHPWGTEALGQSIAILQK